jgi:hypothetical protein
MKGLGLWRSAPIAFRIVAGLGLAACATLLGLALVSTLRSRPWPLGYFIPPVLLFVLSLWLLLERYRPVAPPQPPKPVREANEAVMPVPLDPPRSAVGRGNA